METKMVRLTWWRQSGWDSFVHAADLKERVQGAANFIQKTHYMSDQVKEIYQGGGSGHQQGCELCRCLLKVNYERQVEILVEQWSTLFGVGKGSLHPEDWEEPWFSDIH